MIPPNIVIAPLGMDRHLLVKKYCPACVCVFCSVPLCRKKITIIGIHPDDILIQIA